MGDLDCGDCNCDGCDCDCNCDCCCCIEDCCSGENNVILCCCLFPSSNDNATRTNRGASTNTNTHTHTHTHTHTDCSLCCCCCTSPSPRSNRSKEKRSKCFCSRLWSWCIGSSSKPSSPPRGQSSSDDPSPVLVDNTECRTGKQASWEGVNSSRNDYKMDGRWSRPERYGDHYQRQFQS